MKALVFPLALLLVAAAASVATHRFLVGAYAAQRELDVLDSIPTSTIMKPLTMGYESLAADYYYLKAIQHFGDSHYQVTAQKYPLLYPLLNLAVSLDPFFTEAYIMAGLGLTVQDMDFSLSTKLLRIGHRYRPTNYRIAFLLGFNLYQFEGKFAEAAQVLAEAARLPEAPDFLPGLAARLAAEGRTPETGIALLDDLLPTVPGEHLREAYVERRGLLVIERDCEQLDAAVAQYRQRFGNSPASPGDLVHAGLLPATPEEPFGGTYALDAAGACYSTARPSRLHVYR